MIHRKRNERNIMQPGCNAAVIRRAEAVAISNARADSFIFSLFSLQDYASSGEDHLRDPHPNINIYIDI